MAEQGGTGGTGGFFGNLLGGGIGGVVAAVGRALDTMDPRLGASAIGQVQGLLRYAPGLSHISGTLEVLREQLASGAPQGAAVGPLLARLSEQTRAAAGSAGPLAGPLRQLAERLSQAGASVSTGE